MGEKPSGGFSSRNLPPEGIAAPGSRCRKYWAHKDSNLGPAYFLLAALDDPADGGLAVERGLRRFDMQVERRKHLGPQLRLGKRLRMLLILKSESEL